MSDRYMDLVILTNGSVRRAPGFSNAQPGYKAMVQGVIYDVLEVLSVTESEALLTLPRVYGYIDTLKYDDEDKQGDGENV